MWFPDVEADFDAIELVAPQHSWPGNIASGNLIDAIGSLDLAANAVTLCQQAIGVTGWTRTGVRFNQTANQRFSVDTGSGPDPATVEVLLAIVVKLTTPVGVRGIMSLGTNVDVRHLGNAKLRINVNSSTAQGAAVYADDVYLVMLRNDPTGNVGEYETSINTPNPVRAPSYTDPVDGRKGIGGIAPTTSFDGVYIHGWMWRSDVAPIPDRNEVATKLGWVEVTET